jgi:hypothetical protein
MRLLGVRLRFHAAIAAGAALVLGLSLAPAPAQADTMVAPQVFVRLLNANNEAQALTDWQPLPATLTSLGPYDIGVALQATSATANRQAVEVDLASEPGGPIPNDWSMRMPYSPACKLVAGSPGQIQPTGAILYYHGSGAYALNVSTYTEAQYNAITGQTCSGGPNSAVTLNVAASTGASIVGAPLVPRITRKAHGFNGLQITLEESNQGNRWICARDPVFHPGGPVTGTTTTSGSDTQGGSAQSATVQLGESDAFTKPGLWACSAQALGGDDIGNLFGTPWATTPAVTIKGEYGRDQTRTSLRRLAHGRMRMTVPALPLIAPFVPHGRLTLTIDRAACASLRTGKFKLHRVIRQRARIDSKGRALFGFSSPTRDAFYLGRLAFGGTTLILRGQDAPIYLGVIAPSNPSAPHTLRFIDPNSWSPC